MRLLPELVLNAREREEEIVEYVLVEDMLSLSLSLEGTPSASKPRACVPAAEDSETVWALSGSSSDSVWGIYTVYTCYTTRYIQK